MIYEQSYVGHIVREKEREMTVNAASSKILINILY